MNKPSLNEKKIQEISNSIRRFALEIILEKGGGYLSQANSSAEILAVLYGKVLRFNFENISLPFSYETSTLDRLKGNQCHGEKGRDWDQFFISPAHYAMGVYCALVAVGILSADALKQFGSDGSNIEAIGNDYCPGFETNAGSLGQTVSIAAGTALCRKKRGDKGRVFVFLSDGELQSGQTWEAVQAAVHYELDNLIIVVDNNFHQVEGLTKDVMNIECIQDRFSAFGSAVQRVNGHDPEKLAGSFSYQINNRPLTIICDTNPTYHMPFMEKYEPYLHYFRINDENKFYVEKQLAEMYEV